MKKFLGLILLMLLPCSALSMWGQTGQQMKLISYNIWNGFEGDSLRRARFIEWTRKQAADIFVSVCCHCEGRGVSCRSAFQAADRSD